MIEPLDQKITDILDELPLGLANGKMGLSIYFFCMGRLRQETEYTATGEKILDSLWKDIKNIHSIDVKDGLSGIGLGIDYLIKNNYVEGDINKILEDVDNEIFKQLSYPKYSNTLDSLSLIHILYYLCQRYPSLKNGSESQYLYQELIIQTVNNLYKDMDSSFYEEPFSYNIDYPLPQYLFVLSKIYSLGFYNDRLIKIIEELIYKVSSILPRLHSNRLYLLWGMVALNKIINDKQLREQISLLKKHTDFEYIFNNKTNYKNIFFKDSIMSIYLLIRNLQDQFDPKEIESVNESIKNNIYFSETWNLLDKNKHFFEKHIGLYDGYAGISLLLQNLELTKQ